MQRGGGGVGDGRGGSDVAKFFGCREEGVAAPRLYTAGGGVSVELVESRLDAGYSDVGRASISSTTHAGMSRRPPGPSCCRLGV